jgi:hypothetical protein
MVSETVFLESRKFINGVLRASGMITYCSLMVVSNSITFSTGISLSAFSTESMSFEVVLTVEERNCFFRSGRSPLKKSKSLGKFFFFVSHKKLY